MRAWPLSIRNTFSRFKAKVIKQRTAGVRRLSDFPAPQLSRESAATLQKIFQAGGFTTSPETDSPDGNPALTALKRLFVRAEAVKTAEAARVLSPLTLDELILSGILVRDGGMVRSLLQAQSYQGLIFFSDYPNHEHGEECVMGVSPSGEHLAGITIRRPVQSALDIGCDCGLQSLLTAQHCTRVTATDINPRALAMTRLNADLNGVANIELLQGNYLEPVRGRRFDLILANLPYVISPETKLIYRDSQGDAYLHRLIREIPACLTDGGHAQLISHWVHGKDEPWWGPLETTLEELGMDAWLIHDASLDPEKYADWWLSHDPLLNKDRRKFAKTRKAWLQWFLDQGIEQIALGDITLRRRISEQNWVSSASVTKSLLLSPAGEQIARLFEAQDFLSELTNNEELLETALIPLDMQVQPGEDERGLQAVTTRGMNFQVDLSPFTAEVLRGLDGRTRLREAVQKASREMDEEPTFALEIQALLGLGMLVKSSLYGG
jgi:cyclopropane fatty-acyl-phospholipid synthase-like methyltransferase